MKSAPLLLVMGLIAVRPGVASSQRLVHADTSVSRSSVDEHGAHGWPRTNAPRLQAAATRLQSPGLSHSHAPFIGAVIGGVAGGLATAAYVLNATGTDCVTVGPPCPRNPHTTLRVVTITAGTVSGSALGAWIGHAISARRER